MFGIGTVEDDPSVETACLDLSPRDVEHALREVDGKDMNTVDAPSHGDGQVAGSGGHVEDPAGLRAPHDLHDAAAPQAVDAHRERMVEQVVFRGDVVEHHADLLLLGQIGIVGFHS